VPHDIVPWLEGLGLGQYAPAFIESGIGLDILSELSEDDLKDLGLNLGDRRRLQRAIQSLSSSPVRALAPTTSPPGPDLGAREQPVLEKAERRQLTVVFCDLVGSTELSHRLDPEEMREVIRRYQDAVAAVVARYEGSVAKFLGDGVLAYFGWPRDWENQAERAIRAGLDATAAVAAITLDGGQALRARVGIATGRVVIGDIVGEAAAELDAVVGETPNLAARLQGIAAPGQVVIGPTTRQLIGNVFELEDLGPQGLKGFSEAVGVWRVIGEGTAESRFEASHAGMLARFVGREHELGLLHERWELARGGEGQIVLLSGEAGIGKSRILQALRDEIGEESLFRLHCQCSPHHTNSAFYPMVQRLERAAGFAAADTAAAKLDKLEALLEPTAASLKAVAPLFAALLSLPAEARYGPLQLTPQQRRDRTVEALIEQVLSLSRQAPVLLVVEDAHWVDPSTEHLIGEIMPRIAEAAVLVLITYRPEYRSPWADHPHVTSVALNRLSRRQGIEVVRAAGGDVLPEATIDRIIARADGVPLYLEELTKSLVEARSLAEGPLAEDQIPATLQALLIARLDRLGEAKHTAQVGSVFGRQFSYGLLTAVAESPEPQIHANLERLVQSELIFRRGVVPDAIFTFKHALVQDAAYGTLLRRRRQQLHAQIADVLEREFPELIETEPETLAHHYSRADNAEKAVRYLSLFAKKATGMYAHTEALGALEEALAHAERLLDREADHRTVDLVLRQAESLHFLGRRQRIVDLLDRHRDRLERLEDSSLAGQYYFWLGFAHAWLGHRAEAARDLRRSLDEATRSGDEAIMGRTHRALATECVYSGQPLDEAVAHGREAALLLERTDDRFWFSQALFTLSYCCVFAGELDTALAAANRLAAFGESTGIRRAQANAAMLAGLCNAMIGETQAGIELCERALELSPDDFETAFVLACLGRACAEAGDTARAVSVLEQAVELADRVRSLQFCAWFRAMLAEAYLLDGAIDKADRVVRKALAVSLDIQFLIGVGLSRHLLGRLAKLQDALPDAEEHLKEAVRLFATLGARFEHGRAALDLAALAHTRGDRNAAASHLKEAHDLFEILRIPNYADRAKALADQFGTSLSEEPGDC
jgi:class 3 adenylate cyclase/tetratricopeptide (TPR) repeat protein